MTPLAFASCAGSVIWNGRHALKDHQVHRLCNALWDEQIASRAVGDFGALARADNLIAELLDAFAQAKRFRQASGPTHLARIV